MKSFLRMFLKELFLPPKMTKNCVTLIGVRNPQFPTGNLFVSEHISVSLCELGNLQLVLGPNSKVEPNLCSGLLCFTYGVQILCRQILDW